MRYYEFQSLAGSRGGVVATNSLYQIGNSMAIITRLASNEFVESGVLMGKGLDKCRLDDYNRDMEQTQMTTTQAAKLLGVDIRTIQRLCKSGKLTGSKFGRDWQVERQSVIVYQSSQQKVKG